MLADYDSIGFVHTTDVARSRPFYVDVLGLDVVDESPFALVLRSGRTTIRVTPVDVHEASPSTVLGWSVPDIDTTLSALMARGVQAIRYDGLVQNETGVWQSPSGARVAWFADPDGNTLSLTQF